MAKPAPTVSSSRSVAAETPPKQLGPVFKVAAGPAKWADDRIGVAKLSRPFIRKVFPDHWSFLLGEVALYSFIILLLTGVFLTLWFKPSMAEIEYEGTYQLLRGLQMSEAFESTLAISFDIRGGLLIRQMHHWAAMLFLAAMLAHSLRIFFTGAFRKPREINWLIGVGLLFIGLIEGFAGYSLPDDLLSGTGLRFVDGLIRSIPIIGTWAEMFVFAGEFPGSLIVARLYMAHILLIPAVLLGLIAAHLALVVYHKHTQYPGPGRNDGNVVGYPVFPVYMAKAGGFFFIVFGVITLMGGLMQINPLWTYGPYNPAQVTAGSQPDWYMGFVEGAIRIMPNWESHIGNTTWSWNVAIPGLGLMGLMVGLDGDLPVRRAVGDRRQVRAPHPRPAAQRPDPDRVRRRGDDLLRTVLDRWRQRPRGHPVRRLPELGHLLPAGDGVRRPGDRVHHHQADLHRAAAGGRRAAAARFGERHHRARSVRWVLRGAHADRPGGGVHAHPARRAARPGPGQRAG